MIRKDGLTDPWFNGINPSMQSPSPTPQLDASPEELCRERIERFKLALSNAPQCSVVNPARVGTKDIDYWNITEHLDIVEWAWERTVPGSLTQDPFDSYFYEWEKARQAGLVEIEDGKAFLKPVRPYTDEEAEAGRPMLFHAGLFRKGEGDNVMNMEQFGVFGSPKVNFPTYLMTAGSGINPFARMDVFNEVYMLVDPIELLKMRTVFVDPETVGKTNQWYTRDRLGASFFVLGGIPQTAISRCWFPAERQGLFNKFQSDS